MLTTSSRTSPTLNDGSFKVHIQAFHTKFSPSDNPLLPRSQTPPLYTVTRCRFPWKPSSWDWQNRWDSPATARMASVLGFRSLTRTTSTYAWQPISQRETKRETRSQTPPKMRHSSFKLPADTSQAQSSTPADGSQ